MGARVLRERCDVLVVVDVLSFSTAVSSPVSVQPLGGRASRLVLAGCLRNATAVARWLRGRGHVGLVPAGERWPDGSLRPAYEDLVGAGAIADRLLTQDADVELSPEAEAAALAFRALRPLELCPSGIELVERGWAEDVRIASEVDASDVVPVLAGGRFVAG